MTDMVDFAIGFIEAMDGEYKRKNPLPEEIFSRLRPRDMLALLDDGYLGMDGFQFCFREYAQDCWRRCHGRPMGSQWVGDKIR